MHCELCPMCPTAEDDVCGYFDLHGVEFADGEYGCRMPRNKIEKMVDAHDTEYGWMGTIMGMEHDFEHHGWSEDKVLKWCKHIVGLDWAKPYTRHGKKFYKAYRNYWSDEQEIEEFEYLVKSGLMKKHIGDGKNYGHHIYITYSLTERGLEWLSRMLHIKITRRE